jgi:hypothetical protein
VARGLRRFLAIAACLGVGAAFAIPLGIFVAYDLIVFQPDLAQARRVVASAPPQDRLPPETVAAMICVVHHGCLHSRVARAILLRDPRHRGMLGWNVNFYLTDWMVRVHLSNMELISLYATLGERDNGLTASARSLFQKDPAELDLDEAATVVLTIAHPRVFKFPDLVAQGKVELFAAPQRMPALMKDCTN